VRDDLAFLNFDLPEDLIAQTGAEPRDASRLLVVDATPGDVTLRDRVFRDLVEELRPGDLMVFNESKVIPARVMASKPSGGRVEVLLLREERPLVWSAMLRGAKRAGRELLLGDLRAEVVDVLPGGERLLRFEEDVKPHLERIGSLPLPPYIHGDVGDRYQTVYAREAGSVAAPTAGLHFTPDLLARLEAMGVERAAVTLHVGAGTFRPVTGPVEEHVMHAERFEISPGTAGAVNRAKREGRRVVAVGTTTVRALESAWHEGELRAGPGETSIFIRPGDPVHVPDVLITNFHLPNSTLLLLVAAFSGRDTIREAYAHALRERYRFYSLGDAMLLPRM